MRVLIVLCCMMLGSAAFGKGPARVASEQMIAAYRQSKALSRAGRFSAAVVLAKHALALAEKDLGPDHVDVRVLLNNLASIFRAQGRHAQAIPLYKRYIVITNKRLGPVHQDAGIALNNLGQTFEVLGRYKDAEPLIKRSLKILTKALGPEHNVVGTILNNLAFLYQRQGRYDLAEPLFKRALLIKEKALPPGHREIARSVNNLAGVYDTQGQFKKAEPLFLRALKLREKLWPDGHPDLASTLNNLARIYMVRGQFSTAEPHYRRAMEMTVKLLPSSHPRVALSISNMGLILENQGRLREAERFYERALSLRQKVLPRGHPDFAQSFNNLASLYEAQGRIAKAEIFYKKSLNILHATLPSNHPRIALSLGNLALLYVKQKKWKRSHDLLMRGTGITIHRLQRHVSANGKKQPGPRNGHKTRQNIGSFNALVKVAWRLGVAAPAQPTSVAAPAQPTSVAAPAQTTSFAEQAFTRAQWARGTAAAQALQQMATRAAAGNRTLAGLIRERQDLNKKGTAFDSFLVAAASRSRKRRNLAREQDVRNRLADIDRRNQQINVLLQKDFPKYSALTTSHALDYSSLQELLGESEVLVFIYDTDASSGLPEETFIWAVTKTQSRWVRIAKGTGALRRDVAALRCGLDRDGAWDWSNTKGKWIAKSKLCRRLWPRGLGANEPLPFDLARAHGLYQALFGKIEDLIKGKALLIVPSGPLTTLPFQVLATGAADVAVPESSRAYGKVSWLARRHAITVLPSVASLKSLRQLAKGSKARQPFIGFGNPLLEGNGKLLALAKTKTNCADINHNRSPLLAGLLQRLKSTLSFTGMFRGGSVLADVAAIRNQIALPETADELCAIARTTGAPPGAVNLAGKATEDRLKTLSAQGQLANARVLHFATHGLLADEAKFLGTSKAEPGLILTPPEAATPRDDGFLSASEITTLKLDADWVILSACNTAGGDGRGDAQALSGLARAFFYAGARALLVSHWYVNSDAAVALTTGALSALKTDPKIGRSEALRRSMLGLVDKGGSFAHPAYWAPFIVVGEGGAGR